MRMKAVGAIITALFASLANGQGKDQDKVLVLTSARTPQDLQVAAVIVRTISDIQQLSVDEQQTALNVHGTPDRLALAEWLVNELNQPAQPLAIHAYPLPVAGKDVVRMFFVFAPTPQDMQELATTVRSIADVQRLFVATTSRAVVARGAPGAIALAEWVLTDLNQPTQPGTRHEYRPPANDYVARVFYLQSVETSPQLQEIITTVRSVADMQRIFVYNSRKAITLRGPEDMVGLAEWLIDQLDQPARPSVKLEYALPAKGEFARIFYLTWVKTPQEMQQVVSTVRSTAYVQRLFVYTSQEALTLRGTAGQVATAERLLEELNKSK